MSTPEDFDGVRFEVEDGIASITIDRPEAGNALTSDQRVKMGEWLARCDEDLAIRCVVLQATGRFFCTGADLSGGTPAVASSRPADTPERVIGERRRMMLRGAITTVNAILDCEVPVIAKVQGTAAGIGAHLAFACDLVIVSENAKFIEVFARRALAADGLGTWLLPRLVGLQRAKELILLAEDISAAPRPYEIGLAARVVPADELDATVAELARRLADGPTRAHAVNKWLLNRSLDVDRATMAQEEAWIVDVMAQSLDSEEGVSSFMEKRAPNFRGY